MSVDLIDLAHRALEEADFQRAHAVGQGELVGLLAECAVALTAAADLAKRVERAKALHVPNRHGRCVRCGDTWPCPTVAALTGEDDQ